ncbi:hypothetical protein CFP56_002135 [Quercus suber]|uniref:Transmembrane protein n=1 Tax=Quercus suber TaxID=58331 RepID=A0AAW0M830_QUESU
MEVSRSNYCFAAQLEKSKLSSNKSRRPRNPFTYIDIKPHKFFFVVSDPSKKIMGFSFEKQDLDLDKKKNVSVALTVTSSNITAAIYLAAISLTLCSLIGAWITNSTYTLLDSTIIYGDTSESTMALKYISLLTCFLLAFSCFVQSARHLVNASYLISNPSNDVSASSVVLPVLRGGEFWSLGLRALYFALNLLLWFFGPIPMFVCSIVIVIILHCLDSNSHLLLKQLDSLTRG